MVATRVRMEEELEVELDYNPGGLISYKEPEFNINGKDYKSVVSRERTFARVLDAALEELEGAATASSIGDDDFAAEDSDGSRPNKTFDNKRQTHARDHSSPRDCVEGKTNVTLHVDKANKAQQLKSSVKRRLSQFHFVRR